MIALERKRICRTAVNDMVLSKDNMEKSEKVKSG